MIRKIFVIFVAVTTLYLTVPSGVNGGAAPRVSRIGILIPESGPGESQTIKGLKDGLKNLGYVEGQNLLVELGDVKGDRSALATVAAEFVNKKVDLIFTTGNRATQAAKSVTKQIPIVFRHPADPVALGLVRNMQRPDENVTGVGAFSSDMVQQRLGLLKEIAPNLRRVHIFYDANSKYSDENLIAARKAAAKLRLEVIGHPVKVGDEIKYSFDKMQAQDGDAIFQIPDDLVESNVNLVFEGAKKLRMATMFDQEAWATKGSLASYGPNYVQMGQQAAQLVDKLLKGAKPSDVPVQAAGKFDFVINLRIANIIGLDIPREALKKADRVIR
jgi:putative ABC transport system substrate-binding protein